MNMHTPQTLFTSQLQIPEALFDIIDALYDWSVSLRLIPREMFEPLVGSEIHKKLCKAIQDKDYSCKYEIDAALRAAFTARDIDVFSFEFEAAQSILFQPEDYISLHEAFATGRPITEDCISTDLLFRMAPPWAQLQYVLLADYYDADPDTFGIIVSRAWKTGKGQSIMSANFTFEYCTEMFKRCNQSGLNALETAPKKPIGKTLYRGGALCPLLSGGMSWTEDRKVAEFFAKRLNKQAPVVLSTPTSANTVLARYKHEAEVVLSYDEKRPFEVEFI